MHVQSPWERAHPSGTPSTEAATAKTQPASNPLFLPINHPWFIHDCSPANFFHFIPFSSASRTRGLSLSLSLSLFSFRLLFLSGFQPWCQLPRVPREWILINSYNPGPPARPAVNLWFAWARNSFGLNPPKSSARSPFSSAYPSSLCSSFLSLALSIASSRFASFYLSLSLSVLLLGWATGDSRRALSGAHFNASLIFDLISVKMIRPLGRSRGAARGGARRTADWFHAASLSAQPHRVSSSCSPLRFVADESSPRKNPFA